MSNKLRWNENVSDDIFKFCLALTNMHVRRQPLVHTDLDAFNLYKNRLYSIGEERGETRKRVQEIYRCKRKQRTDLKCKGQMDTGDVELP